MDGDVVNFGMRLAVGTLFLASGAAKLKVGSSGVMQSVGTYKIVSARSAVRIGTVRGPAEVLVGGALPLVVFGASSHAGQCSSGHASTKRAWCVAVWRCFARRAPWCVSS